MATPTVAAVLEHLLETATEHDQLDVNLFLRGTWSRWLYPLPQPQGSLASPTSVGATNTADERHSSHVCIFAPHPSCQYATSRILQIHRWNPTPQAGRPPPTTAEVWDRLNLDPNQPGISTASVPWPN
ncbi:MAG: hypothetical protein L0Z62_18490 [Gemmataceae bacterium]|nr:hypothetical protein [Gemmataceae bacterium]